MTKKLTFEETVLALQEATTELRRDIQGLVATVENLEELPMTDWERMGLDCRTAKYVLEKIREHM